MTSNELPDSGATTTPSDDWDVAACEALIDELWALRAAMLAHATELAPALARVDSLHRASATNLAHYLAMRRVDLRSLQERLAALGLSSLGRAETHVLANLDKVLGILHRLAHRPWTSLDADEPTGYRRGRAALALHAHTLFGPPPAERSVRIMMTLPSEAADDAALVQALVQAGMDIARINCAHDAAPQWLAMAAHVRAAAQAAGRPVRVLMDLAGPKLRTGPIAGAASVYKLKPLRNAYGRVTAPAKLGLRPLGSKQPIPGADLCLGVDADWLAQVALDARIDLSDARGAHRQLRVIDCAPAGVLLSSDSTAYLTGETVLRLRGKGHHQQDTLLGELPEPPGLLHLRRGDVLHLVPQGLGCEAVRDRMGHLLIPAVIACTLPEALAQVRQGEQMWFDDGRIGGVVLRALAERVEVEITHAREGGEKLGADKGINLPDTALQLPALSDQDLADLAVVARCADIAGLSFAQSADDVRQLRERLVALGAPQVGVILKIETRRGFEHLPEMLLEAMASPAAGVMIARGDLAVECGYERMAEVQEEILWACEAAHMPVVWATQVLETLAKTGLPSRAEISDAAMSERAECVMLNKGPHILEAMRTLDDILRRMQAHQLKKQPLLRALKAWGAPQVARKTSRKPVARGSKAGAEQE